MKSITLTIALFALAFTGTSQSSITTKPVAGIVAGGCYSDEFLLCGTSDYYLPTRSLFYGGRDWMSTGLTTLNLASVGVSSLMMINGKRSNLPYYIGIGTGLAQTGYGTLRLIQSKRYECYLPSIGTSNRLAKVNIGIGAVTTLFNTFGLIRNIHKKRQDNLQINLFSFQEENQGPSMGFTLIKKF